MLSIFLKYAFCLRNAIIDRSHCTFSPLLLARLFSKAFEEKKLFCLFVRSIVTN